MRGYGLEKAREYIRSGAQLSMPSGVRVFVDFDGTISLEDTTDVILERFADPEWRKVEAEWLAGPSSARANAWRARSISCAQHLRNSTPVVEDVPLDPHFPELVALCRNHGVPLTVISDGLDRIITKMLARAGRRCAGSREPAGMARAATAGASASRTQPAIAARRPATASARRSPDEPGKLRILIGDGRSDFCAAETADLVVAKGALAEHCQATGLAYIVFGNFAGATTLIARLDRRFATPRRQGAFTNKGTIHASTA